MIRVLLTAPLRVKPGQVFEIKLLLNHLMETGHRRDLSGQTVPREIIHSLTATLAGEEIARFTLFPAIAANPYFAFTAIARRSGDLVVRFTDDKGTTQTETRKIVVDPTA
jgi:sulfur-oxidizing protein SoxZ